jgi:MFS family permease
VQGLGAAMLAPAALALVSAAFSESGARARAVAVWTATAAAGGASGWVLGGVLTHALGWEAVFLVNLPVGAAGIALAPILVAESRLPPSDRRGLDVAGAATVTAGLTLLIYGLTRIERVGLASPGAAGALALAAVCLAAWLQVERRAPDPLVPLAVLRSRQLAGANLAALALTATTTPAAFLCVLYLQRALERAPTEAGLAMMPFNLAVIAGSVVAPRLRLGPRHTMAAGLAGIAAGALLLLTLTPGGATAGLLPAELLMGSALGAAAVASTASGTASVDAEAQGLVSGLLNAAAQVGTALGLALLITLATARAGTDPSAAALVDGYRWGFVGAALLAAAAAAIVLRLRPPGGPPPERPDHQRLRRR